jgi:hypothetical protein
MISTALSRRMVWNLAGTPASDLDNELNRHHRASKAEAPLVARRSVMERLMMAKQLLELYTKQVSL